MCEICNLDNFSWKYMHDFKWRCIHKEKFSAVLLISLYAIKYIFIIIITTTPYKVKRQQTWSPQQKFYASLRHIKLPVQFHLDILLFLCLDKPILRDSFRIWIINRHFLLLRAKNLKKLQVCKRNKNFQYA